VAGRSAAGLRMTPADPASTVGQVDIWAEPGSGLPLMVEIFARGSRTPALETQFFGVEAWHPQAQVLTPQRGPGTGFTVTSVSSLPGALSNLGFEALPAELAGRVRVRLPGQFYMIGVYGGGLATFVVLGVHGSGGLSLVADALSAGGTPLEVAGGTGALIGAPLINAVLARPIGSYLTFLVAGTVSPQVLEQAADTLVTDAEGMP
jgi:hypothetical protein